MVTVGAVTDGTVTGCAVNYGVVNGDAVMAVL